MDETPLALVPPPEGYTDWLVDLKGRIHTQRTTLAVSRKLVLLYWQIGRAATKTDFLPKNPVDRGRAAKDPVRVWPDETSRHRRLLPERRIRPGQALASSAFL